MKKSLSILIPVVIISSCLVGCGKSNDEKGVSSQIGLTWSNWVGSEDKSKDVIKKMIDDYNTKQNKENKITQINWPWGDTETQLALRAQGKDQYDIAQIDIKMLPTLAQSGILADLGSIFSEDYMEKTFPQGSIDVGKYKGVQYGIPWTVAPMAMIENPTILKESKVNFEIKTIADFEKACEMVKNNHPNNKDEDKGNDIIPYAAMTKDAATVSPDYQVWLWTFGANVFDKDGKCTIDSSQSVECLKWFASLKEKGYIQEAMDRGNARTLYKEGRVAFYDDALAAKAAVYNEEKGSLDEQARPILRPVLKEGDLPQAQSWGHLLVVIDRSPKKEEAKKFIEYLISKDVALNYLEEVGMLPSTKEAIEDEKVKNDYWTNSWRPILENGRLPETCGKNFVANNQVMLDQIQGVLNGSKTAEEACKSMNNSIIK